ncbi:uncharacterized protein LOC108474589 [Gossypium arboreum]|uniref:uncharacterized protein LOC108474589 n=1 Tax=Gossypium arboreum TaxID=29729 RepID=UPI0022F18932|nr:uncharacterized protein LOC108474589 [Gossypium arboreum]
MCIPKDDDLRQSILREAHSSLYPMHPGKNKMYQNLRELYWCPGLKHEVMDYEASIGMAPYEALYGQRCRTPTCWIELGEQRICPELVANTEDKVKLIQDRLKEALDRQKSYAVLKHQEIEYAVGDLVFFKLELPPELSQIHDVFHVPMLRWYRSDPSHVVVVEEIDIRPGLTFEEEPIQIIGCHVKVLRRKFVPLVKVLWRNHKDDRATYEPEETM